MAVRQARLPALALVDARDVGAADQQVDAGGAGLQRGGGAIHGRGARAHHADALAAQGGVVHRVGRVRPQRARQLRERRHIGTAEPSRPVASTTRRASTVRSPCGVPGAGPPTVGAGLHRQHGVFIAEVQRQHAAVPAQVVHPLQARDLVERFPRRRAELGLVPGSEGQRRQAQRGAGQLLGRAQRFHARGGGPGTLEAFRRAVEDVCRDAQVLERGRRRGPPCRRRRRRHRALRRLARGAAWSSARPAVRARQVTAQARFQRGQPSGASALAGPGVRSSAQVWVMMSWVRVPDRWGGAVGVFGIGIGHAVAIEALQQRAVLFRAAQHEVGQQPRAASAGRAISACAAASAGRAWGVMTPK